MQSKGRAPIHSSEPGHPALAKSLKLLAYPRHRNFSGPVVQWSMHLNVKETTETQTTGKRAPLAQVSSVSTRREGASPAPTGFCGLFPRKYPGELLLATLRSQEAKQPPSPPWERKNRHFWAVFNPHFRQPPPYATSSRMSVLKGVSPSRSPSQRISQGPGGIRFRQVHKHCIPNSGGVWPRGSGHPWRAWPGTRSPFT